MGLRTRFTIGALLLVVAVLASTLFPLYSYEKDYLLRQMDAQTLDAARKLAQVCQEAVSTQSDLVALNYMRVWLQDPGAREAVLVQDDGTVYLDSRMLAGDSSRVGKPLDDALARRSLASAGPLAEVVSADGARLRRLAAPVNVFGRRFGSVLATYQEDALEQEMSAALADAKHQGLAAMSFALAVGVILAVAFAGNLARPLHEVVEAARRIGTGDFSALLSMRRSDELGTLVREFNLMARKLRELEAMKDRFLHSVSHEMRAPLAVMASAAYHARRVCEPDRADGLREDIAQIEAGIERVTGFVDNILDLARLQAGRVSFSFARIEPGRLLDEARTQFTRRAEEFGLALDAAAEGPLPALRADPGRLQQVLANLILNAFKFAPSGSKVEVRAREGGAGVVFSVADAGPGIPAEAQGALFTRFTPSAAPGNPRRLPSSGLGLSICKEIVEAHGGRIWMQSEVGRGSVFFFSVPRWSAEAAERPGAAA